MVTRCPGDCAAPAPCTAGGMAHVSVDILMLRCSELRESCSLKLDVECLVSVYMCRSAHCALYMWQLTLVTAVPRTGRGGGGARDKDSRELYLLEIYHSNLLAICSLAFFTLYFKSYVHS